MLYAFSGPGDKSVKYVVVVILHQFTIVLANLRLLQVDTSPVLSFQLHKVRQFGAKQTVTMFYSINVLPILLY